MVKMGVEYRNVQQGTLTNACDNDSSIDTGTKIAPSFKNRSLILRSHMGNIELIDNSTNFDNKEKCEKDTQELLKRTQINTRN